jgi:hypothetical protein
MKNWFNTHYKTLIIAAFLIPIMTVAVVSISHVTQWYGISNPVSWAVYLSIGIEIAALSALAAISANMGSKVYFPFAIVTLVQFIGNIFFAYSYIDIDSKQFKDWVDLVSPMVSFMGVEANDFIGHKRFLAFFAGGMLPIISLSFLHMLVKFTEEDRNNSQVLVDEKSVNEEKEENKIDASDLIGEVSRLRLSEEDIKKLEEVLLNPPKPNENLRRAAEEYEKIQRASLKDKEVLSDDEIIERAEYLKEKKRQEEILSEMMRQDQELGLYDEPFNNPMIKEDKIDLNEVAEKLKDRELFPESNERAKEVILNSNIDEVLKQYEEEWGGLTNEELIGDDEITFSTIEPTIEEESENFSTIEPNSENIFQDNQITPALSDEEVHEMFMDEWERKFDMVEEDNQQEIEEIVNDTPISVEEKTMDLRQVVFEPINEVVPEPTPEILPTPVVDEVITTPVVPNEEVEKKNLI